MSIITEVKSNLASTVKSNQDKLISGLKEEIAQLKAAFILISETLEAPTPDSEDDILELMEQSKRVEKLAHIQRVRDDQNDMLSHLLRLKHTTSKHNNRINTAYDKEIEQIKTVLAS